MKAAKTVAYPVAAQSRSRGMESRTNQERLARTAAYLIITLVAVAYVFPLYWMIVTALKTDVEIFARRRRCCPKTPSG